MIRVLYVDDEPSLLDIGKIYLEEAGDFFITTTDSGHAGLSLLKKEQFDAVISDYQMPVMDGIELLKHIRSDIGDIPVIIFTGRGREEIVIEALNSGADFYLQKGGDPAAQFTELRHKVLSAITSHRLKERVRQKTDELMASFEQLTATEEELKAQFDALQKSEQTLRINENRLRMAQEIGQTGAWEYSYETDKIWGSAEGLRIFGYPAVAGAFPIEDIETCIPERERVHQALVGLLSEGKEYNIEYAINPADGSARKVIHSIARLDKDAEGKLLRVIGVIQDITESKRVEEELKNSRRRLSEIISFLPDAIFAIDKNGFVISWNRAMEELTGVPAAQILGKGNYEYAVPFYGTRRPILIDLIFSPKAEISEKYSFVDVNGDVLTAETVNASPQGKNVILWGKASPLYDKEGNVTGAIESIRDITERKQAEKLFQTVFENMGTALLIIEEDTMISHVNAGMEKIWGYTKEEIEGRVKWPTLVVKEDLERMLESYRLLRINPASTPGSYDFRLIHKSGELRAVDLTAAMIPGTKKSVISLRDITEFKKIERSLKESEEKLAAIVASSPVPKFVIDSDHKIMYWNRALEQATGISAVDMIGTREQWRAFYPEERPTLADLILDGAFIRISELYAGKFSESPDFTDAFEATDFFPHIGDKGKWLRFMAAPIKNDHGITLGAVETLIDVTDIMRAEGELLTKNEELQAAFEEITATEEELRANLDELTSQERALRESEERYRNIVEDQTEFICRFLPDGTHLFVNDAYCRYFGVAREVILGHRFSPVLYDDDRKAVAAFFATLTLEKPVGTIDHRIIMPDGTIRWQRWSDRAIFDPSGRVIEYQSVGRDITERKLVEAALQKSEENYRHLIENANEAIIVAQDGLLKFANPMMATMTGYSAEELTTLPYIEIIHPDDRAIVRDRRQRRISGEKISSRYMFRINSKDNSTRWVEISAVSIDWEGRPATLNFLIDITTRRLAEKALKESEEFNRELVENMPDMVIVYGLDRKIRYGNPTVTRMLGYSMEEQSGADILDYVVPEQRLDVGTVIREWLTSGSTESIELNVLKKDGGLLTVISNSSMVHFEGEPAVLILLTNITERKELENLVMSRAEELARLSSSLEQTNRKLNLLSSITRHDINNQLSVLVGYLRILEKKQPDPTFSEYFLKIATAAQRISAMIRFTKEYEDIGVTTPAWQDARTIVNTAAKEAPLGRIIAKNDLPAGAEVFADPLIVKVCYNLMDNSARYGGKITTIRFYELESNGNHIIVCEDDGDGIPAGEKEQIFERGFGKNTGLGLALAREILSITGITIKETGEPGKGARFEITVPKVVWRMKGDGT